MKSQEQNQFTKPPENALRVQTRDAMCKAISPATYRVINEDGNQSAITVSKGNRIVLDTLLKQPVFCASPVRISDNVCILRNEYGVPITKEMYENDSATGRAKFGVYFLDANLVQRIEKGGNK